MKLDLALSFDALGELPALARQADALGFAGLWTSESAHDPFLPLVLAAEHTQRLELGTAIAVAFARSPMEVAYQAWDLARFSEGRFRLGLGTQVRAHIERRFAMPWGPPVPKLRDFVAALRAIWQGWQTGERLRHEGPFYRHTLMSPFFDPGPNPQPRIPIYLAGVNEGLCRLAGEVADGFHVHPYHSAAYLREQLLPWIAAGAADAGRSLADVQISAPVFVVTGADDAAMAQAREEVRRGLAFYASTPSYRPVMAHHGWGEVADALGAQAARQQWAAMPPLVSDEMVESFAVVAPPSALAAALRARYAGLLDRLTLYRLYLPDADPAFWRTLIADLAA